MLTAVNRTRDEHGVVHETYPVSFPQLASDNDVYYVDGEVTECQEDVGVRWSDVSPKTPVTCLRCVRALSTP